MECNRETILDELNDFEKRSAEISPILEDYLAKIAKTGDTMFPWVKLKPLLKRKTEIVLDEFYETCPTDGLPALPNVENFKFEILKSKILEAIDAFQSAPFTIQRICELLTSPRKHYKRTDKFMRGLEKNILVVSTVEPNSPFINEVNNNSGAVVNGMIATENEQAATKRLNSANFSPSKPNSCAPQFDNFGALSSSSSSAVDEMPAVSQPSKNECPESATSVNSNNVSIDKVNDSVTDMDVTTYSESHIHGSEGDHCYSEHQSDSDGKSPSDLNTSLSNNSTPLENFAIFTPPSSVGVMDANNLPQNDGCLSDSVRKFNSKHEREMGLGTFQSGCDSQLVGNTMYMASPVPNSEESYPREKQITVSHPSHATGSDREFFSDLCCELKEGDSLSAAYTNSPESFVASVPVQEAKEEIVAEESKGNSVKVSSISEECSSICSGEGVGSSVSSEQLVSNDVQPPQSPASCKSQPQIAGSLECQLQSSNRLECQPQSASSLECQSQLPDDLGCQPQTADGIGTQSLSASDLTCHSRLATDLPSQSQSAELTCHLQSSNNIACSLHSSDNSVSHSESTDVSSSQQRSLSESPSHSQFSDGSAYQPQSAESLPSHPQSPNGMMPQSHTANDMSAESQSPDFATCSQSSDHLSSPRSLDPINLVTQPILPSNLRVSSQSSGSLEDSLSPTHSSVDLQSSDSFEGCLQASNNLSGTSVCGSMTDCVQPLESSSVSPQSTNNSSCQLPSPDSVTYHANASPDSVIMATPEGTDGNDKKEAAAENNIAVNSDNIASEVTDQELMDVEYPQKSENQAEYAQTESNAANEAEAMEEG